MQMCKRGPNVRFLLDSEVVTVDGFMNEMETRRQAFQNVGSEVRAAGLWDIAPGVARGDLSVTRGPSLDE